jgi:hypothetical protein
MGTNTNPVYSYTLTIQFSDVQYLPTYLQELEVKGSGSESGEAPKGAQVIYIAEHETI